MHYSRHPQTHAVFPTSVDLISVGAESIICSFDLREKVEHFLIQKIIIPAYDVPGRVRYAVDYLL